MDVAARDIFESIRLSNSDHSYQQPGTTAVRSPCPALNTLANHGFINRDGRGLTKASITSALMKVYNLDAALSVALSQAGVSKCAEKGSNTLDLDQLDQHGLIEHDASLTRNDSSQGNNHDLVPGLLDQLLNFSPGDGVAIGDLASLRVWREKQSTKLGNPKLSKNFSQIAVGESALLFNTFAKMDPDGIMRVPKTYLKTWFGEERLPDGWKPTMQQTLNSTAKTAWTISTNMATASGDYKQEILHTITPQNLAGTIRIYAFLAMKEYLYMDKHFFDELLHRGNYSAAAARGNNGDEGALLEEPEGLLTPFMHPQILPNEIPPDEGQQEISSETGPQ
jgi:hypothetical protein